MPASAIPRLQGDIVIDGKLDDVAWQGALVQEIAYEIQPGDNTPAPVKTIVRIGYTTDALYARFRAMDPDPASVRANLRDRDSAVQRRLGRGVHGHLQRPAPRLRTGRQSAGRAGAT